MVNRLDRLANSTPTPLYLIAAVDPGGVTDESPDPSVSW